MMANCASILYLFALVSLTRGGVTLPDVQNFAGARIFHPAFPNLITQSVSIEEANNMEVVRKMFSSSDIVPDFSGLPWKILPSLGISDKQDLWSKSQILDAYEKNRHQGHLVWWDLTSVVLLNTEDGKQITTRILTVLADLNPTSSMFIDLIYDHNQFIYRAHKLDKPEKGCILLNHWSQRAVLLTDYDLERGAKGYEVRSQSGSVSFMSWPPLSWVLSSFVIILKLPTTVFYCVTHSFPISFFSIRLEFEMTEKASRWQAVRVSDNIASGEVFSSLPGVMTKAPWELIFLLLLSKEQHADTLQALFDTGLCPRQGLIAYIRLLEQVQQRAESWEGVPNHRKITEFEIFLWRTSFVFYFKLLKHDLNPLTTSLGPVILGVPMLCL